MQPPLGLWASSAQAYAPLPCVERGTEIFWSDRCCYVSLSVSLVIFAK